MRVGSSGPAPAPGRSSWAAGLIAAAVIGVVTRLGTQPAAVFLFLYSLAFFSVPLALLPVRGRLLAGVLAQRHHPAAQARADRLTTAWIIGFLSVVCLAAVTVLMTAGPHSGA